jgi:hypothetical protein
VLASAPQYLLDSACSTGGAGRIGGKSDTDGLDGDVGHTGSSRRTGVRMVASVAIADASSECWRFFSIQARCISDVGSGQGVGFGALLLHCAPGNHEAPNGGRTACRVGGENPSLSVASSSNPEP